MLGKLSETIRYRYKRIYFGVLMLCFATLAASTFPFSDSPAPYQYLLPALPFAFLFILALFPRVRLYTLVGATAGAILAIGVTNLLLWIELDTYTGGGVNFWIALLFFTMPIYVPLCMIVGAMIFACFQHFSWLKEDRE